MSKRIISLLLALIMTAGLCVPALAAEEPEDVPVADIAELQEDQPQEDEAPDAGLTEEKQLPPAQEDVSEPEESVDEAPAEAADETPEEAADEAPVEVEDEAPAESADEMVPAAEVEMPEAPPPTEGGDGVTLPVSGTCGAAGNNLSWRVDEAGVLTISGSGNMANYTADAPAPWFDVADLVTSVVIKSGVTSIGSYAFFACWSMTRVDIPATVTSIGANAFDWCSSLTSVTIPGGVTAIADGLFRDCASLTGVTVNGTITSIGDQAFFGCVSLTSAVIPSGVTSIGANAYDGCVELMIVTQQK